MAPQVSGGGRRYPPYAFTEQGVAMLSSVLKSKRAIQVNIEIMRTFVRLRRILASHAELARKLDALEKKYDAQFRVVFDAIRQLSSPPEPEPPKKRIGFLVEEPHQGGFCFGVSPCTLRLRVNPMRHALCAMRCVDM